MTWRYFKWPTASGLVAYTKIYGEIPAVNTHVVGQTSAATVASPKDKIIEIELKEYEARPQELRYWPAIDET